MSRRADLQAAAAFAVLGGVIAVASWRMERLQAQGINPWSVPGLTPGILGVLMIVFAVALAWQARDGADDDHADVQRAETASGRRRSLVAAALCTLFAGIGVGSGVPFAGLSIAFVFGFITLFSWHTWREQRRTGRGLVQAAAIAVGATLPIVWLFESVFLVRLP